MPTREASPEQRGRWRATTVEERFAEASRLYSEAREVIAARERGLHRDWTDEEVEIAVRRELMRAADTPEELIELSIRRRFPDRTG